MSETTDGDISVCCIGHVLYHSERRRLLEQIDSLVSGETQLLSREQNTRTDTLLASLKPELQACLLAIGKEFQNIPHVNVHGESQNMFEAKRFWFWNEPRPNSLLP